MRNTKHKKSQIQKFDSIDIKLRCVILAENVSCTTLLEANLIVNCAFEFLNSNKSGA